jgi:hypothetical protein
MGWLEFSTLRYYSIDLHSIGVDKGPGDVMVRLLMRVPHDEIERALWEEDRKLKYKKGLTS